MSKINSLNTYILNVVYWAKASHLHLAVLLVGAATVVFGSTSLIVLSGIDREGPAGGIIKVSEGILNTLPGVELASSSSENTNKDSAPSGNSTASGQNSNSSPQPLVSDDPETSAMAAQSQPGASSGGSSSGGSGSGGQVSQVSSVPKGISIGYDAAAYSSSTAQAYFYEVKAAGAEWVRFDLYWTDGSESSRGVYNWSAGDRTINAAVGAGLKVLVTVQSSPSWARATNCFSKMCPPASAADYGNFVKAAVLRYKDRVKHWEIWNEPNIKQFWNPYYGQTLASDENGKPNPGGAVLQDRKADPVFYTAMLKDAYTKIKQADSSAIVITAGTSPSGNSASNMSHIDFLNGIYNNGGKGYFDAIAHHPYCYSSCKSDPWQNAYGWKDMQTLYSIMSSRGDGSKKVWATEFGTSTPLAGNTSSAEFVTEARQAQIVTESYSTFRSYSWSGPLFWYRLRDSCSTASNKECWMGLKRANSSALKAAYNAYAAVPK